MSARNRELIGLLPASLLVMAGFAAVFIERRDVVADASLTYGLVFLGLCLVAHLVIRVRLPDADPYVFPIVAVLAGIGLVVIYRIDDDLAREQAQWFVVGLGLFTLTLLVLRDYRALERYRYLIAAASLLLLLLPRVPGIGSQVNGAYLGIDLGPLAFQPAEFAKIGIIVFLASYLRDTRQMLVVRTVAGIPLPPLKHRGPAAGRMGAGDGDARGDPRSRLVADVLRRVPGDALRGDEPRGVPDRRARACSHSAPGSSPARSGT